MADENDISERYELVERIAVGGMAEVFRAKKYGPHGFAKQLAVKRILPSLAASPEFVSRFIAEAKIAVTLSHANIVQVFDFSRFGDSLYIAMEFVDGVDVATLSSRSRKRDIPIGVASGLHIAIELLKGLQFAHRKEVVHRDVSPSNILVSRAGEVKIADFGIAQAAGFELTSEHRVMGKWPYMSPEQTRGEDLDQRTDLFSAGAVIYEVITGHRLFRGRNADEIVAAIAERQIPLPSKVTGGVPASLDAPILGLLARAPGDRKSAAETLDMLTEASFASSVQATAASLADTVEILAPLVIAADPGAPSPAALLDDVINSELAHARAVAPKDTRITLAATSHGRGHTEQAPALGAMSFIKTSTGVSGLSEWLVGDSTGMYSITKTARLFSFDDGSATSGAGPASPSQVGDEAAGSTVNDPSRQTMIDATGGLGDGLRANPAVAESEPASSGRAWLSVAVVAVLVVAFGLLLWPRDRGGGSPEIDAARVSARVIDAGQITAGDAGVERLEIRSTPAGAEVWQGDVRLGVTPDRVAYPGPGTILEFRASGYGVCRATVGPASVPVTCALAPVKAQLTVLSEPPGAVVSLDGKKIGKTPIHDRSLEPRAGSVDIVLSKSGFRSATAKVVLAAGSVARVNKRLEPEVADARIDIYSEPWANVYFRGKKIGVAPVRGLVLPAGRHQLTLVNPVQNRRTVLTVTVPAETRYKVVLPPAE